MDELELMRERYFSEMEDLRHTQQLLKTKMSLLLKQDVPDERRIQLYEKRIEMLDKAEEKLRIKARSDGVRIL